MNRNTRRLIFVLLLLIVGVSWLMREPDQRPAVGELSRSDQPDYFLRGMDSFSTGQDGKMQHRMMAHSLLYFPDEGITKLEQPFVEIHQGDGSLWTVQAHHGHYSDSTREIILQGSVLIEQNHPQAMSLETESLRLLPDSQFAETHDPVQLRSAHMQLQGTGMKLYGEEQRLQLLSHVRGIYHEVQP